MKNKIITISFIAIIIGIFCINLIKKDEEISILERRKLASFPKMSIENIINGKWVDEFEDYTQDQFVGRDLFKNIKLFWNINIFKQKDNNKMFVKDGALYKMEYPLSESNVKINAEKIKKVYDKYLSGKKVYFSIIPEKNYYLNFFECLIMQDIRWSGEICCLRPFGFKSFESNYQKQDQRNIQQLWNVGNLRR